MRYSPAATTRDARDATGDNFVAPRAAISASSTQLVESAAQHAAATNASVASKGRITLTDAHAPCTTASASPPASTNPIGLRPARHSRAYAVAMEAHASTASAADARAPPAANRIAAAAAARGGPARAGAWSDASALGEDRAAQHPARRHLTR